MKPSSPENLQNQKKNKQEAAYATYEPNIAYSQTQEILDRFAERERKDQDEAYATYQENIDFSNNKEAAESAKIAEAVDAAEVAEKRGNRLHVRLGRTALNLALPFATEFIQRHNSHQRMKHRRRGLLLSKPILDTSQSEIAKFTGSVDDFRNIYRAAWDKKEQERAERRRI